MQNAARNFLIDGCEIGDYDACVAFNAGNPYMADSVSELSDSLRVGRTAYVCNGAISQRRTALWSSVACLKRCRWKSS